MHSQMEVHSASLIIKYVDAKGFWVAWDCSRPQKIFEDCWMQVYRIDCGVSCRSGGDSLWKVVLSLFEKCQGLDFFFKYEVLFLKLLLHVPKILFELLCTIWWGF